MRNGIHLKIWVDNTGTEAVWLREAYTKAIEAHNRKIADSEPYADSGFDLLVPASKEIADIHTTMIDHGIRCSMTMMDAPTGFMLYPRSSLSKTPLMLANHVGIIDSGYRGNIIGAFRKLAGYPPWTVLKESRLLQICHPTLLPIYVELVEHEQQLGERTMRGEGGFGST